MKRGFLLKAQAKKAKRNARNKSQAGQDSSVASVTAAMEGSSIAVVRDSEVTQTEEKTEKDSTSHHRTDSDGRILRHLPHEKTDEADKLTAEEKKKYSSTGKEERTTEEFSFDKVDYPRGLYATTIPSMIMGTDGDPNGHTEWLFRDGSTKAKVLNAPGYPDMPPRPLRRNMYEIKEVEGMGFGMFASRDIEQGQLIFAERPLLIIPASMDTEMVTKYRLHALGCKLSYAKYIQLAMADWEVQLQLVVDRLSEGRKKALMSLHNSHTEDGTPPIFGIARTNGFQLGEALYDGPDKEHQLEKDYVAICEIGSRINHSCISNISFDFSLSSFSMQFYATQDIKKGEQIFFSYFSPLDPRAARHARLIRYGITCKCLACETATPESDRFRDEFQSLVGEATIKMVKLARGDSGVPDVVQADMDKLLALQERAAKENIPFCHEYVQLLIHLSTTCEKLGYSDKAKEFHGMVERLPDVRGDYSFSSPQDAALRLLADALVDYILRNAKQTQGE